MSELTLKQFQRKLDYLSDRQEIYDCICRYVRGVDRHDPDIVLSAYHDDAIDVHGNVSNDMHRFAEWANALHDADFSLHTHNITSHLCEIDGDEAHAESYVLFGLARRNEDKVWFGGGRYIDRLERRAGTWAIALRRTLVDWMFEGDAAPFKTEYYQSQGYPAGTHDRSDLSYQRPLRVPD